MNPLNNQDGMALLLVLVIVTLLSALLIDFSFSTLVDLRATETFRDRTKAYYLARGGVEAARMILQQDKKSVRSSVGILGRRTGKYPGRRW